MLESVLKIAKEDGHDLAVVGPGVDRPLHRVRLPRLEIGEGDLGAEFELAGEGRRDGEETEGEGEGFHPLACSSNRISSIASAALSTGRMHVPAPRWPPPPYFDIRSPTEVLQVRLKMLWPTAATTLSRDGPQCTRSETFASGKSE